MFSHSGLVNVTIVKSTASVCRDQYSLVATGF